MKLTLSLPWVPFMLRRYKHILGAGLAAIVLGVPFGLRLLSDSLEIYPAILLPSGATLFRSDTEQITFRKWEIIGLDLKTNAPLRLNPISFFKPVPQGFIGAIINNEFGLNPDRSRDIHARMGYTIKRPKSNSLDERDREFTNAWLRERLKKAGCAEDLLVVRVFQQTFNKNTKALENVTILNEKTYRLR